MDAAGSDNKTDDKSKTNNLNNKRYSVPDVHDENANKTVAD